MSFRGSDMSFDIVTDGFGSEWPRCDRPNCGLEVVRPGKSQCWCDNSGGQFWKGEKTIPTDVIRDCEVTSNPLGHRFYLVPLELIEQPEEETP